MKIPDDIHLDTDKAFDFIDQHLPERYSRQVWNMLPENKKVALDYIRRVRKNRIKNIIIMSALYRVAQFNKIQQ